MQILKENDRDRSKTCTVQKDDRQSIATWMINTIENARRNTKQRNTIKQFKPCHIRLQNNTVSRFVTFARESFLTPN